MTKQKREKLNKIRVRMGIVGFLIMMSALNELDNTVAWWWIIGLILSIPMGSYGIITLYKELKDDENEQQQLKKLNVEIKKIDAELERLSKK